MFSVAKVPGNIGGLPGLGKSERKRSAKMKWAQQENHTVT